MKLKVYRIYNKYHKDNDIILSVENIYGLECISKLNAGLAAVRPWDQCVPYYKGNKFGFISKTAMKYFLFSKCGFNIDDIIELENNGYVLSTYVLDCYTKGLSNIYASYFDDEIEEGSEVTYKLTDVFKKPECPNLKVMLISDDEIEFTKERYYKNVKTFK